jgi:broad-specificity NMP kinase
MHQVQIIGLPGAGKTEGITKFLEKYDPLYIHYLDIRNFSGRYRERLFRDAIKESTHNNLIAESACGVYIPGFVIRLDTPIELVYRHLKKRGDKVDCDYLSLLSSTMVPADRTIKYAEDLPSLLKSIFG